MPRMELSAPSISVSFSASTSPSRCKRRVRETPRTARQIAALEWAVLTRLPTTTGPKRGKPYVSTQRFRFRHLASSPTTDPRPVPQDFPHLLWLLLALSGRPPPALPR